MGQEESESPAGRAGTPVDEAVTAIVEDEHDPEAVRRTLQTVAEDGVVSGAAVESRLAHVSKLVATPETRVELAAMELSDAREAAEPVADIDAVRSRLDSFETRLAGVEERVEELGAELQAVTARPESLDGIHRAASRLRRLDARAKNAQGAADELTVDIEEFEAWLDDPDARFDDLAEDADAVAETLADLERTAGELADAGGDDPAATWLEATLRHRVADLLLADARAELADLRAWNDREGIYHGGRADAIADRLDDLDDRCGTVGDRLDGLARPEWTRRHGDRLAAFESAVDGMEPPVAWGIVQAELDEHLPTDGDEDAEPDTGADAGAGPE
jgi:DNA repair ATPase RecN